MEFIALIIVKDHDGSIIENNPLVFSGETMEEAMAKARKLMEGAPPQWTQELAAMTVHTMDAHQAINLLAASYSRANAERKQNQESVVGLKYRFSRNIPHGHITGLMAKRISEHLKYLQGPITDGERESGRALTKAMVTALLGSWSLMVEWQEAFSNEELFELAPYLPDEWETLLCR